MKTMKIYEPAMCCPTGLCGVGVDPELLRISTVLNTLGQNGVEVKRYNLTSAPAEFVKNKAVTEYLQKFGPEKLPVALVDDIIVIAGRYPTNEEFTSWLELSADVFGVSCCDNQSSCCCGSEETTDKACCCGEESTNEGCCCDGEKTTDEACCCGGEETTDAGCCCGSKETTDAGCCCGGEETTDAGCCCGGNKETSASPCCSSGCC